MKTWLLPIFLAVIVSVAGVSIASLPWKSSAPTPDVAALTRRIAVLEAAEQAHSRQIDALLYIVAAQGKTIGELKSDRVVLPIEPRQSP